jgi:hypothetical protein
MVTVSSLKRTVTDLSRSELPRLMLTARFILHTPVQ